MFGKLKGLARFFSNEKLNSRLKELEPIISSNVAHKEVRAYVMYSSLPVLFAGLNVCNDLTFGLFIENVPGVIFYTLIYSSLHSTLLAGVHFGFASAIYRSNSDSTESRYLKIQLYYPFLAPILTTYLSCAYWVFPFTHLKSLYTISGIGLVYLGVFVADSFFADRAKVLPLWYKEIKRVSTLMTLSGILLLLLVVYKYPEETKLKELGFPRILNN
jgi:hypothetical protein